MCRLYCEHDHLDLCNTRQLPTAGDLNARQLPTARDHNAQQLPTAGDLNARQLPTAVDLNAHFPLGRFWRFQVYTVPKVIDFLRYNTKSSGDIKILRTRNISCSISLSSTFRVISRKFGLLFGQCYRRKHRVITLRGLMSIRLFLVQNFLPWWGKCAHE